MSCDLAEFLLARIAEDEDQARRATAGPWAAEGEPGETYPWSEPWVSAGNDAKVTHHPDGGQPSGSVRSYDDAAHIAHWGPQRVLAECEAKRQIAGRLAGWCPGVDDEVDWDEGRKAGLDDAARYLAAVYADHPDYRPEWRAVPAQR